MSVAQGINLHGGSKLWRHFYYVHQPILHVWMCVFRYQKKSKYMWFLTTTKNYFLFHLNNKSKVIVLITSMVYLLIMIGSRLERARYYVMVYKIDLYIMYICFESNITISWCVKQQLIISYHFKMQSHINFVVQIDSKDRKVLSRKAIKFESFFLFFLELIYWWKSFEHG